MNERIKIVRKNNKLSQAEFGNRIGITKSSVSLLESGKNQPSEQTINLICKEFEINYLWLTQGIGSMEEQADHSAIDRIDAIMTGSNETAKSILKAFSKLGKDEWTLLAKIIKDISEEIQE